jgi:hypothetical protein
VVVGLHGRFADHCEETMKKHFRFVLGVASSIVCAPAIASAQDGTSPPPASPPVAISTDTGSSGVDGYLFTAGLLTFGIPYAMGVTYAQGSYDSGHHGHLYAPVAGPWIDLANRPSCTVTINTCDHSTRTDATLIADGLLQAGGVLIMLDALFLGHHGSSPVADDTRVHFAPTTYAGTGAGLSAYARF